MENNNRFNNRILVTKDELLVENNKSLDSKVSDFSKYIFCYYTTLGTLEKILGGRYFYVSNFEKMNDLDEAKAHMSNQDKVHALCFSNSNSESVPMWYLYSGILGKGACLKFTPAKMIEFIKSIKCVFPVIDGKPDESVSLEVGTDVEIQYGWIYYQSDNESYHFKNKWYAVTDDAEGFINSNYFIKQYPWHYEREFRIVFINKTNKAYEKIAVKLDESLIKKLKVILAPEIKKSEIKNSAFEGMKLDESSLKIKMALLSRNQEEIYTYILEAIKNYESAKI